MADCENSILTVLTCTGDRPFQFSLCERWQARQHLQPSEWIVVDDGHTPTITTMGQRVIRRPPSDTPVQSFCRNLLAGLESVQTPFVAIVEDDDWYSPWWLTSCVSGLQNADLFGESHARYFNLRENRWHVFGNRDRASLCSTALRAESIPHLVKFLKRERGTAADIHLWRSDIQRKQCVQSNMVVGLKGYPSGRQGAASGHLKHAHWPHDPERRKLREWIGEDVSRLP